MKKQTKIAVPDSIKINGATYKVTSIAKSAFKNNKKLKTVTIGKNVSKIGEVKDNYDKIYKTESKDTF